MGRSFAAGGRRVAGAATARELRARPLWPAILAVVLLALALLPSSAAARASQLTRYPYLTDVVGEDATVNWATTNSSSTGTLKWGEVGGSCTAHTVSASKTSITVGSRSQYQWKAKLSDLEPNTRYCYRVYLGSSSPIDLLGSDGTPQFLSQPRPLLATPFKFAVLGDWGLTTSSGNPYQADVLRRLSDSGARFALSTGDIAYEGGTQTNYGDLFQTGANVSTVFGPNFWTVAGAEIPMFPSTGNHGRNSTFLLNWPQASAAAGSGGRYQMERYCCLNGTRSATYPSAWYAFDVGSARFYVLDASWSNSNVGSASLYENDYDYHWTTNSPEYKWLEQDLRTHPAEVKFAFFHFPLYSANADEKSDTFLQGSNSLEGLLGRYGVDIVFNGHAHVYERNNPSASGRPVSYVTGAGGAKPAPVSRCSAGTSISNLVAYAIGWSSSKGGSSCGSAPRPTSIRQVYHFLLVSVDGSKVTVTPTDSTGRTFDVRTFTFPRDVPLR